MQYHSKFQRTWSNVLEITFFSFFNKMASRRETTRSWTHYLHELFSRANLMTRILEYCRAITKLPVYRLEYPSNNPPANSDTDRWTLASFCQNLSRPIRARTRFVKYSTGQVQGLEDLRHLGESRRIRCTSLFALGHLLGAFFVCASCGNSSFLLCLSKIENNVL